MHLTLAQSDLSTCEVSNALIKLGGHIPTLSPESSALPGVRLCGLANTVHIVSASDRIETKLQQSHFVDHASSLRVIHNHHVLIPEPRTHRMGQ
jgi:hypothetical protein